MKNTRLLVVFSVFFASSLAWGEDAAKIYKITGRLAKVTSHSVFLSVPSNDEVLTLSVSNSRRILPRNVKVGDLVTVWYTLNLKKASLQSETPRQAPGQAPGNRQQIIEDDRIFYDAENKKIPSRIHG